MAHSLYDRCLPAAAAALVAGFAGAFAALPAGASPTPTADALWVPLGELLTYRVEALGVEAGLLRFGVTERFDLGDRTVATLAGEAHAKGVYRAVHPMMDAIFSRLDLAARRPVETVARYGDPGDRWDVRIDHATAPAARTDVKVAREGKSARSWAHPWRAEVHDPLSALYALRGRGWNPGDRMKTLVYVGWDLFAVEARALKREWIATSFGPQRALSFEVTAVRAPNPRLPGPEKKKAVKVPGPPRSAKAVARSGASGTAAAKTAAAMTAATKTAAVAAKTAAAAAKPKPPKVYRLVLWVTDDAHHVPLEARATYEGVGVRATLVERAVPSS